MEQQKGQEQTEQKMVVDVAEVFRRFGISSVEDLEGLNPNLILKLERVFKKQKAIC